MARQPPQLVEQQQALGRYLAVLREAAGLYQVDIARAVPCHRTTVTHAEAGSQLPDSHFWETADRAVGANGALLAGYDALIQAREAYRAEQQAQRRANARAHHQAAAERVRSGHAGSSALLSSGAVGEPVDDPDHDPVLSAAWSHRGTVEASVALSGGGDLVERRGFLFLSGAALTAPAHQWLVHEPEQVMSGLSGKRVSVALADRLPSMIAELRAMDDVAGGDSVLAMAAHSFDWVSALLNKASYDERTRRKLLVALAEFGQLAGWTAYDAGQQGLAQRYYIAGLRAAHCADDRRLGAHILGFMAYQAAHQERPDEAVTLVDTALAGVRGWETPNLLAELYIRRAYAHAVLQDASASANAVAQARGYAESQSRTAGTAGDDPSWLYWVRPAEMTAGAGDCLLQLGKADQAATLLSEAITLFDVPFDRDRYMRLVRLAEAYFQYGDIDATVSHATEALKLNVTFGRGLERIRQLGQQLRPHAQIPAVRDFLEQVPGSQVA